MELNPAIVEQEQNPVTYENVKALLVFRKGGLTHSFSEGWDLYLPAGRGMKFWQSLVYAGGKAICYEDYQFL